MSSVGAWMKQPYSPDMDVWGWVLFVIFVLIIAAAWMHTVSFITGD